MSIALVNQIRPMTGFTFAEKSILFQLASVSHDGKTVFLRVDKLSLYAGCSVRTAQRALRRLEQKGVIVPQGETGGRGYVNVYKFNLDPQESAPEEPGNEAIPAPPVPPDEDKWYENPRKRREGESFLEYNKRVESLK